MNKTIEWMFVTKERAEADIARGAFTKSAQRLASGDYLVPVEIEIPTPISLEPGAVNIAGRIL